MTAEPRISKHRILASHPLFSTLDNRRLEQAASVARYLNTAAGECIFLQGNSADRFFFVAKGQVIIRKAQEDDEEGEEIARFVRGDCFGDLEMLSGARRSADAVAMDETRLLAFPGDGRGLSGLLATKPDLASILLHRALIQVSARIRDVNALVKENSPLVREWKRQAYTDKLTGLENRTALDERLAEWSSEAPSLALLMFKPDNFKEINDRFGHEAGDAALVFVAKSLATWCRERGGSAYRFQGNAMAALFPDLSHSEAEARAEDLRLFLWELDMDTITKGDDFNLTASVGFGSLPQDARDGSALLEAVKGLPLQGRAQGGNRVLAVNRP